MMMMTSRIIYQKQNQPRIALRQCQLRTLSTAFLRETSTAFPSSSRSSLYPRIKVCCPWIRGFQTSQRLDDTHRVNMPSLSPTMTDGTILKWLKKEGETIAAGDVICEIQTDKAVVSLEMDDEVILAKIIVPENTADIKVGTLIALTVDEGDDWKSVEVPAPAAHAGGQSLSSESESAAGEKAQKTTAAATPSPSAAPSSSSSNSSSHGSLSSADRLVGPAVKHYLQKYGLSSSSVPGSGPHGTVTKGDVLKHVLNNKIDPVSLDLAPSTAPAPTTFGAGAAYSSIPTRAKKGHSGPASFVDLEITNMRRTIAKRLLQSKSTIPHAYGTAQCNMNQLNSFRESLVASGLKVSVNDLLVKCVANALALNPAINCTWEGDQLKQQSQADISVAVATPNGLITPIVTNVGGRDVQSVSEAVRALAAKAREGKLQPHEFMGGGFSISNLGMFGIHSFSAIINPPQCAILAVGGASVELGEDGKPLSTSKLQLSYDASAIMEDDALKFLATLKNEVENVNESSMGESTILKQGGK